MDHSKTVATEFTRQARAFAEAPLLQAPELTDRVVDAFGDAEIGRLLDVGCGPGVLTPKLAPRARLLVGIDLTAEVLRLAQKRAGDGGNIGFVRGLIEQLPFASASVDAAVLRLALHHFDDRIEPLKEIRRVLRSRGRLVVLDILTSEDPETARLHNAIECLRDPSHVGLVPLATLRDEVCAAGFTLERQETWTLTRDFAGWARIINEPQRMDALAVVLRRLARSGVGAGIDLREEGGELIFDYTFALLALQAD